MGLLGSVGKIGAGQALGGFLGAGLVGAGELFGGSDSAAQQPDQIDPRFSQSVSDQSQAANDFRSNLGNYKNDRANISSDRAKYELAQKMAGTRSNLSSRGLLYGGVRQGQEARGQAQTASRIGQERAGINSAAEDQAQQMDTAALQNAMSLRQLQQQRNEFAYNQRMDASDRQKGALGGILSAGGMLAGYASGGSKPKSSGGSSGSGLQAGGDDSSYAGGLA